MLHSSRIDPCKPILNSLFANGTYDGHYALFVSFETGSGELLRITKEYSLAYIPRLQEWHGDVIAYGQWIDLEPEEIQALRETYNLDELAIRVLAGNPKQPVFP